MYSNYDEMFSFSDPEEGAEFVNERLLQVKEVVQEILEGAYFPESIDEIPTLIEYFKDAATKVAALYDEQLEEADTIMRSAPDPDYKWDNRP
jgi:hypothetical protein